MKTESAAMRPIETLNNYSRLYPNAWKQVDEIRAKRGISLPYWPEWCFMPLAGARDIVIAEAEKQGLEIGGELSAEHVAAVGVIGALAAWRVTQGIYRFDPDVYREVIKTPITGKLPNEIFLRLPEWCIYVETPGYSMYSHMKVQGFFCHMEYNTINKDMALQIVFDFTMGDNDAPPLTSYQWSLPITLGDWDLAEAVYRTALNAAGSDNAGFTVSEEYAANIANGMNGIVSLIIYICATNADIGTGENRPKRPKPKITKKGSRLFPPNNPQVWDIGIRMGAALRREHITEGGDRVGENDWEKPPVKAAKKSPHIRRAHWHTYWTGPKNTPDARSFYVKWMPPIAVKADKGLLPLTIRKVK